MCAFNFEVDQPIVKKAPETQKDSYFGFSVAQHKEVENEIGTHLKSW